MTDPPSTPDDFDTPWKDALPHYLPEFLAFYFPKAYAAIDWSRPHTFLDQEWAVQKVPFWRHFLSQEMALDRDSVLCFSASAKARLVTRSA